MNVIHKKSPSKQAKEVLNALRSAVVNALDKKQKLGQYALMWDGEKPVNKIKFSNN
ncbi:MAG: hypothetical protein JJV99_10315 [Colwellia sp.]|nr:hypothetical protein [Colwellia sp.]